MTEAATDKQLEKIKQLESVAENLRGHLAGAQERHRELEAYEREANDARASLAELRDKSVVLERELAQARRQAADAAAAVRAHADVVARDTNLVQAAGEFVAAERNFMELLP